MNTRWSDTRKPRLERGGISLIHSANPVPTPASRKVHQLLRQHVGLPTEIPCCIRVKDQHGRGRVFPKLVLSGEKVGAQTLEPTGRLCPIHRVRAPAMLAFIFAHLDTVGNSSRPNHKPRRSRTWAVPDYPFTRLRTRPDLGPARRQGHH